MATMDTIRTRPRLKIEPTPTDRVVETTALVGMAFLVVATAFYWPMLPKTIPTHFDIAGKVDGWGPNLRGPLEVNSNHGFTTPH